MGNFGYGRTPGSEVVARGVCGIKRRFFTRKAIRVCVYADGKNPVVRKR